MTTNGWIQIAVFLALILAITKPLGVFMARVFNRERAFLDPRFCPSLLPCRRRWPFTHRVFHYQDQLAELFRRVDHELSHANGRPRLPIHQRCRSLHVPHFSVEKRHLEVLVNKNLLGAKIHDLVRLAERGFYLIRALPFLNLLRLARSRLLLRLSDTTTLVASLLVITITMAGVIAISPLSDTLLAGAVIDVQEFCNRIFHL